MSFLDWLFGVDDGNVVKHPINRVNVSGKHNASDHEPFSMATERGGGRMKLCRDCRHALRGGVVLMCGRGGIESVEGMPRFSCEMMRWSDLISPDTDDYMETCGPEGRFFESKK